MTSESAADSPGASLINVLQFDLATLQSLHQVLGRSRFLRNLALVVCIGLIVGALAAMWYAWFNWMPQLWHWSYAGPWYHAIPGSLAVLFLALLPVHLPIQALALTRTVVAISIDEAADRLQKRVEQGSQALQEVEGRLAVDDRLQLVPLLSYSRVQLEAYYSIGLDQTQRSFRYSVVAMWIGFAVIMSGIVVRVLDLERFGIRALDGDAGLLVIACGVVIELISALFLWIYRNSVRQLTYFYNRQIFNHGVLMAHRISSGMQAPDETRRLIVERLLDRGWSVEPDALPSGQALLPVRPGPG